MSSIERDNSAARLQIALDLVRTALLEVDLRSSMVTMTGHVRDVLGLDPPLHPVPFETCLALVHPADRPLAIERFQATTGVRTVLSHTELRLVFPDGSLHWWIGGGRACSTATAGR